MEGEDRLITLTIGVLEDWYQAVENGSASYRFPSADGDPRSDDDIDRIIAAIDEEIDGEIERNQSHWNAKGIFRGSGFIRLQPLQRRALVEDLARAVAAAKEEEREPIPEPAA
jgi:hypothetical protein